jgi:hypothetical protein
MPQQQPEQPTNDAQGAKRQQLLATFRSMECPDIRKSMDSLMNVCNEERVMNNRILQHAREFSDQICGSYPARLFDWVIESHVDKRGHIALGEFYPPPMPPSLPKGAVRVSEPSYRFGEYAVSKKGVRLWRGARADNSLVGMDCDAAVIFLRDIQHGLLDAFTMFVESHKMERSRLDEVLD